MWESLGGVTDQVTAPIGGFGFDYLPKRVDYIHLVQGMSPEIERTSSVTVRNFEVFQINVVPIYFVLYGMFHFPVRLQILFL